MSAEVIRMATEEHGPAEELKIAVQDGGLHQSLRAVVLAGWPEMLPSIYTEHAALLGETLPSVPPADLAQALRKMAHAPGIRHLRRAPIDPRRLVAVISGAALVYSGDLDGLHPAQVTATTQPEALAFLGLPPNDSPQYLDEVAAAIRVSHDDVLAALAVVPQLPHLRGALAAADRFTALPVAGIVFGLMLARG